MSRLKGTDPPPQSKLNPELVRQMRADYHMAYQKIHDLRKRYSMEAMADRHGVDKKTVRMAIRGETWRHVK